MRYINSFCFALLFVIPSFGQTFSMLELIKMSKMNPESFDTYVSKKGFVFTGEVNSNNFDGIQYALEYNPDYKTAMKFITLYSRYNNSYFGINYQTLSNSDYVKIKEQIKTLGFKFKESRSYSDQNEKPFNCFVYSKYRSAGEIIIYSSVDNYQITYTEGFKF